MPQAAKTSLPETPLRSLNRGGVSQDVTGGPASEHWAKLPIAFKALQQKRYAEAEALIKAIPHEWRSSSGYRTLASALKAQGKWREAIQAYRVFETYPNPNSDYASHVKAHAECARRIGDNAEAAHAYRILAAYVSQGPMKSPETVGLGDLQGPNAGEAMALATEAMTFIARGEFRDAVDGFRAALRLRPDYAAARYGLARALSFAGDGPGASREMARAAQGNHAGVRAKAKEMIAVGVNGTDYRPTLTSEKQRRYDAMRKGGRTGPIAP